jgi:hypothetical protein
MTTCIRKVVSEELIRVNKGGQREAKETNGTHMRMYKWQLRRIRSALGVCT